MRETKERKSNNNISTVVVILIIVIMRERKSVREREYEREVACKAAFGHRLLLEYEG